VSVTFPIPTLLPSAVRSGERVHGSVGIHRHGETLMLTLEATAIKVITKGGGIYKRQERVPNALRGLQLPQMRSRNKQSMYEALYVPTNNERLPFKCKRAAPLWK